ncbi:MAG: ATP-binding cassette domain-containing protein [Candidatus Lokiarchaeota archaeon]|nr:ATP-binding cassette domain-containing protein [Candidatus Lokiarchaeota archaeon]
MNAIITTKNVWKSFGREESRKVDAVKDVTIEILKGRKTALGGPSGSGKTTLLGLMMLLTTPTKGKIFIEGEDVSMISEVFRAKIRREKIGLILQANYLLPHLTAVENVALPKLCTDVPRKQAEKIARDKLEQLDLGHRLSFRVAELSGGEQQRVSIARALINNPKILIADEPGSSIDKKLTMDLLKLLDKMVKDDAMTIILASHNSRILDWADQTFMMDEGKIV